MSRRHWRRWTPTGRAWLFGSKHSRAQGRRYDMATTTATLVAPKSRKSVAAGSALVPRRKVEGVYYLFLLPSLILFTLAITLPAVIGIFFSFTNSIGFGDWQF